MRAGGGGVFLSTFSMLEKKREQERRVRTNEAREESEIRENNERHVTGGRQKERGERERERARERREREERQRETERERGGGREGGERETERGGSEEKERKRERQREREREREGGERGGERREREEGERGETEKESRMERYRKKRQRGQDKRERTKRDRYMIESYDTRSDYTAQLSLTCSSCVMPTMRLCTFLPRPMHPFQRELEWHVLRLFHSEVPVRSVSCRGHVNSHAAVVSFATVPVSTELCR